MHSEPVDHVVGLMAEIESEVARRRAAGDLPRSLERELDAAFERFIPVGASDMDGEIAGAVAELDRAATVDAAVPTASRRPGVALVKRILRKLMGWYLTYVAQQVSLFGCGAAHSIRLIARRLAVLEAEARRSAPVAPPPPNFRFPDLAEWEQLVLDRLSDAKGRVLHAECGDGELLRAMAAKGIDAYGVEPRGGAADALAAEGLDAWPDEVLAHLGAVSPGGLAGLVLSGCVDRMQRPAQGRLVELAAKVLAPGGTLVLVSATPRAWRRLASPIEVDLAGGGPLQAETWRWLLERAGFELCEVHTGSAGRVLAPIPGDGDASAALNDAFDQLEGLLFGPSAMAITAVRSPG